MAVPVEGSTPTQIRAENFPDLGDDVMYPRLSGAKLERLAEMGERRSFAAGETLYEQGQPDAPFLVIERGRVRVLDRKPGKDVWVAEADAGTFLGDIATFTGEPAIAECVADEPTEVIAFERSASWTTSGATCRSRRPRVSTSNAPATSTLRTHWLSAP